MDKNDKEDLEDDLADDVLAQIESSVNDYEEKLYEEHSEERGGDLKNKHIAGVNTVLIPF